MADVLRVELDVVLHAKRWLQVGRADGHLPIDRPIPDSKDLHITIQHGSKRTKAFEKNKKYTTYLGQYKMWTPLSSNKHFIHKQPVKSEPKSRAVLKEVFYHSP